MIFIFLFFVTKKHVCSIFGKFLYLQHLIIQFFFYSSFSPYNYFGKECLYLSETNFQKLWTIFCQSFDIHVKSDIFMNYSKAFFALRQVYTTTIYTLEHTIYHHIPQNIIASFAFKKNINKTMFITFIIQNFNQDPYDSNQIKLHAIKILAIFKREKNIRIN